MEKSEKVFKDLILLIRTLRGENGCPWDRKQTWDTLTAYLQKEFQEFMEEVDKKSPDGIQEEMGDVIFLLLFCAEIARDQGDFSIGDVLENVKNKMIGRHPHVFNNQKVNGIFEIRENWKKIKEKEKTVASQRTLQEKLPRHLPGLLQAYWVNRKKLAGKPWFEVLEKMEAEITELKAGVAAEDHEVVKERLGDLLFQCAHLSASLKTNPELLVKESLLKHLREPQPCEEG